MEPYINSNLNVSQKIPTRQVSGLTTGVVVYSEVGPIVPTRVTSPRQFLNLFTVNNRLTKGDHASLHNAYFLSRSVDLVVSRATDTSSYPLFGMEHGGNDSYLLPNGNISDRIYSYPSILNTDLNDDNNSVYIQVGDVLFYGVNGVNPFDDGDGIDTALATEKGTDPVSLEDQGIDKNDYKTIRLSVDLLENTNLSPLALKEIVDYFKVGREAYREDILVTEGSNNGIKIYYASSNEAPLLDFRPWNRILYPDVNNQADYSLANPSDATIQESGARDPYLIGTTNVGSSNTISTWISDVEDQGEYQSWNLNIKDSLNGLITYKVSSDPEAIDAQGNPIYYEWINDVRTDIFYLRNEIVFGNDPDNYFEGALPEGMDRVSETVEPTSFNVGKSILFSENTSDNLSLLASAKYAAQAFKDYEDTRIQLYTDAGWYNKSIAKELEAVAGAKKGLACVSLSPEVRDINIIKNYFAGFNGYYSICHVNGGKDTSLVGFQIPISASCYYIESVARNTTRNSTYAPTFSKVNGPISESNLYSNFNKTQRDELNSAKINVLVYDRTDGIAYINNNFISDTSGSLIDEDQSIRIVNDIQYDIDKLMENFYSRFNVAATRDAVESSINNYFYTNLLSQSYTISGFRVECSEVNNTLTTIQNNELKVDVYIQLSHSIKYITVATNVVPTL